MASNTKKKALETVKKRVEMFTVSPSKLPKGPSRESPDIAAPSNSFSVCFVRPIMVWKSMGMRVLSGGAPSHTFWTAWMTSATVRRPHSRPFGERNCKKVKVQTTRRFRNSNRRRTANFVSWKRRK
jgi:hypothetical protein